MLTPLLGIGDPRTDKRIDFVGGIRGPGAVAARVDDGSAAVGFAMHPVSVADLMAIADAGGIMPPKSTWFEPKLRDGLLTHLIDGEEQEMKVLVADQFEQSGIAGLEAAGFDVVSDPALKDDALGAAIRDSRPRS